MKIPKGLPPDWYRERAEGDAKLRADLERLHKLKGSGFKCPACGCPLGVLLIEKSEMECMHCGHKTEASGGGDG